MRRTLELLAAFVLMFVALMLLLGFDEVVAVLQGFADLGLAVLDWAFHGGLWDVVRLVAGIAAAITALGLLIGVFEAEAKPTERTEKQFEVRDNRVIEKATGEDHDTR